MSDDFKDKLKDYADGKLTGEDKRHIEEELDKLELYQEFLDEQCNQNSIDQVNNYEGISKNQNKIIRKSKWKARFQNASVTLILLSVLLVFLQVLTSQYYKFGDPNKLNLYRNAIETAIQTTRPNAEANGSTFQSGMFLNSKIGVQYSKRVGKEEITKGNLTLQFHLNTPSVVTDDSPDYIYMDNFYFDRTPSSSEDADSTMWSTLEKLPEGTVAEAYITFNKLYETEEVLRLFENKDMDLLWLAVDTGDRDNQHTVLGFPHTQDFPELRANWFNPPPTVIQHYTNSKFRNEYFIDSLKFLNEYWEITNAVDSTGSMPNIQEVLDYVNANGVKILGVTVTGPTKEILKLREDNIIKRIIVGESRLWNWE